MSIYFIDDYIFYSMEVASEYVAAKQAEREGK